MASPPPESGQIEQQAAIDEHRKGKMKLRGYWPLVGGWWCKHCGEVTPVVRSSGRTNWYACPDCDAEVYADRIECIRSYLLSADSLWLQHYIDVQEERLKLAQEQCQRLWDILQEDK